MRTFYCMLLILFISVAPVSFAGQADPENQIALHESQIEEQQLLEIELAPRKKDKSDDTEGFTKHYADSLFKVTDKGLFSVEIVIPKRVLSVGLNSLNLIIHDKNDIDLMGAEIKITPWMPEMGHGVTVTPRITEKGGGLYVADDVGFSMSGRWELRIKVKKAAAEDSVVFPFPDIREKKEEGMEHMHEMQEAPSDLDISTEKLTEQGAFSVSYESDDISVNRFHSWHLMVKKPDGTPVEGAEITIVGDMPEHGHGLPTQPLITEQGSGAYLVEGMKFQMPGWWVVKFTVDSEGRKESATFNLKVK